MAKKQPRKITLSKPTNDELRRLCPRPTPAFVSRKLDLFYKSEEYAKEKELIQLFRDYSSNTTPMEVGIKVEEVIKFTDTDVSERVLKKRILESDTFVPLLRSGASGAVDYLMGTTQSCGKYGPFAYSYCYFQNPKRYLPGHWCYSAVQAYSKLDQFIYCSARQYVHCYSDYRQMIKQYQRFYKLQQFSPNELVYFLHMLELAFMEDREERVQDYNMALVGRAANHSSWASRMYMRTSQNDLILQILQGNQNSDKED